MEDRPVVVHIPRRWIRIALIVGVTTAVVAPLTAAATHGFEDVPDSNTFHADIQWLEDSGVTKGCNPPDNDEFCPDDAVTRGQMSAFMHRLAENQVVDPLPLTAGTGILVDDRNISVDTPLRLSDDVGPDADDADDADASVISAGNPSTDFGTFGIYGEADQEGVSVAAQSAGVKGRGFDASYGVTGEAGDLSNVARALGAVGVVGRGENRGTYGASQTGSGVYATSESNYGLWAQSTSYRGVTGRTNRTDNNYGFYTPDNLFSLNINMAGAMMVVVQNGGSTELRAGDVVSFTGLSPSIQGFDTPVAQVTAASTSVTDGVAGVVASRFNVDAIADDTDGIEPPADIEVTPDGPVGPGEHLLLVVFGPAQVSVQSSGDIIEPGESLMLSQAEGHATSFNSLSEEELSNIELSEVGTALEPVPADSRDLVWVFVGAP